ncbi:MAG: hypothetical protein RIT19_2803, partial [Verrucomicrobiota bacterium]
MAGIGIIRREDRRPKNLERLQHSGAIGQDGSGSGFRKERLPHRIDAEVAQGHEAGQWHCPDRPRPA